MSRTCKFVIVFVSAVLVTSAMRLDRAAADGARTPTIETIIYSFKGGGDGAIPNSRLVAGEDGNLYGTTGIGGHRDMGTVFKLTNRKKTVLHFFRGGSDGAAPSGDLLNVASTTFGTLLAGTTQDGGDHNAGTVYEVNSDGQESVLYSFTGGHDGDTPRAGLVMDQAGNLYGTTSSGGDFSLGTVFELTIGTPSNTLTVLHSFTGGHDGGTPAGGLFINRKGNLFGMTQIGGGRTGTIFILTPASEKMRVLHSFLPDRDGADPNGPLVEDRDGNLYGTAFDGGPGRAGTVFRWTRRTGKLEVVFSFSGNRFGANPVGGLTGSFCGATSAGGAGGGGTVFRLNPDTGKVKILHSFGGAGDGIAPIAGLIADDAGNLIGTTATGGNFDDGTVFKVTGC